MNINVNLLCNNGLYVVLFFWYQKSYCWYPINAIWSIVSFRHPALQYEASHPSGILALQYEASYPSGILALQYEASHPSGILALQYEASHPSGILTLQCEASYHSGILALQYEASYPSGILALQYEASHPSGIIALLLPKYILNFTYKLFLNACEQIELIFAATDKDLTFYV